MLRDLEGAQGLSRLRGCECASGELLSKAEGRAKRRNAYNKSSSPNCPDPRKSVEGSVPWNPSLFQSSCLDCGGLSPINAR